MQLGTPDAALQRIREGIMRYNTQVLGRAHKYHETVTVAFAQLVAHRIRPGESWGKFCERIEDLLNADCPVLLGYYSGDRLFSDLARRAFIEPDLQPLPVPD